MHSTDTNVEPTDGRRALSDGGVEPFGLEEEEGTAIWSFGALMNIKATGEDTGGAFALVDQLADPWVESPYHVHHNEDELFYVLEGEIDCISGENGEDHRRAGPGETVFLPRDIPHGFRVQGDEPCRMLILVAPAGVEGLWLEAGEPAPELTTPPQPDEPPDLEALAPLFEQYGLEALGPIPA